MAEQEERLSESSAHADRLEKAKSELRSTLADLEDERAQLKKRLSTLEARVSDLEDEGSELRREADESRASHLDAEERLRATESRLMESERNAKVFHGKCKEMEAEVDRLKVK